MNYYTKRFNDAVKRHLHISREISKHFLKIGKKETSTIISQKVIISDDEDAHLHTTIQLLPIRRMYHDGSEIVGEENLLYEMVEDIEL